MMLNKCNVLERECVRRRRCDHDAHQPIGEEGPDHRKDDSARQTRSQGPSRRGKAKTTTSRACPRVDSETLKWDRCH